MRFNILSFSLLLIGATPAFAQDIDLHKELNPNIDHSEHVEIRTYKHEGDDATITEYRSGGKVWMIKVQPAGDFPAYYLYDDEGAGVFQRRIAGNIQPTPPIWIIKRF